MSLLLLEGWNIWERYSNKKLKSEEDEVFVNLLKKVKKYFAKLSTGIGECAKISRTIEKEMKKNRKVK